MGQSARCQSNNEPGKPSNVTSDSFLNRRSFVRGTLLLGLSSSPSLGQGFLGAGGDASGFSEVVLGRELTFPADHGPHPDFRIEWWYVTANLRDSAGVAYGAQWTLFRQAHTPGPQKSGWENQHIWMGHAALTRADLHRYSERFARGGIGQAGVEIDPFHAWIDSWAPRTMTILSLARPPLWHDDYFRC